MPKQSKAIIETKEDEKIIAFEVFKHYMAVMQEKNQSRLLKSN